jgi:hypothetical protein
MDVGARVRTGNGASRSTARARRRGSPRSALNVAGAVMAAGYTEGTNITAFSMVDNSGRWSVVTMPTPSATGNTRLFGVSCPQVLNLCEAVGTTEESGTSAPLLKQFNGTAWSVRAAPSVPRPTYLSAVGCAAPASAQAGPAPCAAVGRPGAYRHPRRPLDGDHDDSRQSETGDVGPPTRTPTRSPVTLAEPGPRQFGRVGTSPGRPAWGIGRSTRPS